MVQEPTAGKNLTSRDVTAYHEAGHLVATWARQGVLPDEVILTNTRASPKGPATQSRKTCTHMPVRTW